MESEFIYDWLNDGNKHGKTPLIQSCSNLNTALTKGLLKLKPDLHKRDHSGSTALIETIITIGSEEQKLEIVRLLIDVMSKSDINETDNFGQTALIAAADRNLLNIVKVLIDVNPRNPQLLQEDDHGRDFVDNLEKNNNREWLTQHYPVIDSMKMHKDALKPLLEFKISNLSNQSSLNNYINADYGNGQTLLIQACQDLNFDKVRKLIRDGADVDIQDNNGNTALAEMINSSSLANPRPLENRLLEIVNVFLKARADSGSDVNQKVHVSWITLGSAANAGYLTIIDEIIKANSTELIGDAINGIKFYETILAKKKEEWFFDNYKDLAEELSENHTAGKFGI